MNQQGRELGLFADLDGKVALVTGAFGGLGLHFAQTLARAGCKVALAGRRVAEGEAVLADLCRQGGQGCVVALDVRDPASVGAAFEAAHQQLGPVQVVVNSAGIATTGPAMEVEEGAWQSVIDTNLNGAWRVAQCAARMMRAAGGGSIVNIASILGLRVAQQVPAYTAAKAGLIHLTRSLALEWARHGIRVNALAPGYFETDINRGFFESDSGRAMIARIPQRRLGQPGQLDGALLLLASDASEYMTGTVLPVDGGHSINSL
ncbi:SDR family NAD(P)-dependent oxidoreductase [Cupriavidus neocaledonicus]|uniref:2-deoxy-D-gluconate 3-dehydrogenase n=1 Tax=Cupriavidus neocaledonicus TaxID=1040979 RepID=A0A375HT08_9BURK|nr:SDR family NAD(P)-dependent oxidoreductase [Cupriavidus neocaledonicus]SOZ40883.1 Short chain dehydrogenase [Cupriavidus neocaledonicus]SPD59887.1 2-deoxy-D-gluconate 3-dehydrogenase [Cupriavidus neocaledonicus]